MKINIEDLVEGVTIRKLDIASDALSLPVDEGVFSSPIHVEATLTKTGKNLVLQAVILMDVIFPCSRCLTDFTDRMTCQVDVLYEGLESIVTDETGIDSSEDIEVLDYDAKEIDIGYRIEEAVRLVMPLKPLCREDCQGLCATCGTDLNTGSCQCKHESVDPRWEALKEILK